MALTRYKLGELIQLEDERNSDDKYTLDDVKGISIQKIFIETKADMQDVSLTPYILVKPDYFVYVTVTSRNGEKITLAHNTTDNTYIVSSSYVVFSISRPDLLSSDYLFMYFNRPEFDRFSRFNSWGSARETFSWEDMCDIDIELPSLSIQQKYVDVYNSMLANQKSYERGLEDIRIVCDGYIEKIRIQSKERIGNNIREINNKNSDGSAKKEMGVSVNKEFIDTKAKASDATTQKKVAPKQFAFNTNTSRNSDTISIAINDSKDEYAVSNTYCTFECMNNLLPEYLYLWVKRNEFSRYARFNSWGSARETLGIEEIMNYEISIPAKEIQENLINILSVLNERKNINKLLLKQIKDICPILIKGSIEEAKRC